jgi:hypothetical protein
MGYQIGHAAHKPSGELYILEDDGHVITRIAGPYSPRDLKDGDVGIVLAQDRDDDDVVWANSQEWERLSYRQAVLDRIA